MKKKVEIYCSHTNQILDTRWIFGNRVCSLDSDTVLFGNLHSIVLSKVDYETPEFQTKYTKNKKIPFPNICSNFKMMEVYKKDSSFPAYVSIQRTIVSLDSEDDEFNTSLQKTLIGGIDELGNFDIFEYTKGSMISKEKMDEKTSTRTVAKKRRIHVPNPIKLLYSHKIDQKCYSNGEGGMSSIAFNPQDHNTVATSRYFFKDVKIVKSGRVSNRYYCTSTPTKVKYIHSNTSNNALLCVIEDNQVLLYDERVKKYVHSITPNEGRSMLYDVDNRDDTVGIVGNTKDVFIYDAKKWTFRYKWNGALRRAIQYIKMSKVNDYMYVAGDNEMNVQSMANVKKKVKSNGSIFFDSPIVGFSKWINDNDTISTLSENGRIYVINNPYMVL